LPPYPGFAHYRVLLDPELSNLGILTIRAGLSLLRSSSLEIVYHHYRSVEPAPFLRDAWLEDTLTGEHHDLGTEIDIVLALE
jgi:alginate production protein